MRLEFVISQEMISENLFLAFCFLLLISKMFYNLKKSSGANTKDNELCMGRETTTNF